MRKVSIIAGLAVLAGLFAGCNKETAPENVPEVPEIPEVKMVEITLSTDSAPVIGSKTQLVGTAVHWRKGDKIRINDAVGEGRNYYVLTNTRGDGKSASFTGSVPETWTQGGTYHVFYPYIEGEHNDDNRIKGSANGYINHCTSIRHPSAEQGLKEGSFGDNANPSVAQVDLTTEKSLRFVHPAGLYEFKLRGEGMISKVELVSTIGVALTRATNTNLFYDYSEDPASRRFYYQYLNSNTITLTNEDGIQLGDDYKAFYACLAPYTSKNTSCTIKVYKKGDEATPVFTQTLTNVKPVKSGGITRLGEFSVFESKPLYFRPSRSWANYVDNSLKYFELPSGNVFAAYFTDDVYSPYWIDMTDSDYDGVYECNAPVAYSNVTFVLMNEPGEHNIDSPSKKTAVLDIPAGEDDVYVLNDGGTGGLWDTYVPVTRVYFKPNVHCTENYGIENGIVSYVAYFKSQKGVEDAVLMNYDLVNGIFYYDLPCIPHKRKYSQVSFITSKGAVQSQWNQFWGLRTVFMDIPTDGRNLFTLEESSGAVVSGTWSKFGE